MSRYTIDRDVREGFKSIYHRIAEDVDRSEREDQRREQRPFA